MGGARSGSPALRLLILVEAALIAQVHEAVQHHVLAHAMGEIVLRHAHDRHIRQIGIAHQMIDAGAEREERFEIGQAGEASRLRTPGRHIADGGSVEILAQHDDVAIGQVPPEALDPGLRLPGDGNEKAHALASIRSRTLGADAAGASPMR